METTEKTMNPQVLEFIENAKKAQAEAQELEKQKQTAERDALLISLGLCRMEMVEIKKEEAYKINFEGVKYDEEKDIYYSEGVYAIDVTDEEFEEIKKYAPNQNDASYHHPDKLKNSAEEYLGTLNNLQLALYILGIIILLGVVISELAYSVLGGYVILIAVIIALIVLFMAITAHSITKVILNISNNLHKINSKIK